MYFMFYFIKMFSTPLILRMRPWLSVFFALTSSFCMADGMLVDTSSPDEYYKKSMARCKNIVLRDTYSKCLNDVFLRFQSKLWDEESNGKKPEFSDTLLLIDSAIYGGEFNRALTFIEDALKKVKNKNNKKSHADLLMRRVQIELLQEMQLKKELIDVEYPKVKAFLKAVKKDLSLVDYDSIVEAMAIFIFDMRFDSKYHLRSETLLKRELFRKVYLRNFQVRSITRIYQYPAVLLRDLFDRGVQYRHPGKAHFYLGVYQLVMQNRSSSIDHLKLALVYGQDQKTSVYWIANACLFQFYSLHSPPSKKDKAGIESSYWKALVSEELELLLFPPSNVEEDLTLEFGDFKLEVEINPDGSVSEIMAFTGGSESLGKHLEVVKEKLSFYRFSPSRKMLNGEVDSAILPIVAATEKKQKIKSQWQKNNLYVVARKMSKQFYPMLWF